MAEELFTRKQMENAVMLAADLYQRIYNETSIGGDALTVAGMFIEEACKMEDWLTRKYGEDDEEYLDRLEEYEAMMEKEYGLRLPEETDAKEYEFYSIEPDGKGGKQIHVLGYCYHEGCWHNVEYTGFIEPLQEFIEHLKEFSELYADENYVDNRASELQQYQGEYNDGEMRDIINQYFDGHTADAKLSYSEITIDTPCGDYVC